MKKLRTGIDRFCRTHPNFGIQNLMKYICIANIAFWLFGAVNTKILGYMTFNPYYILHGQIWRIISFIFIPPGTGFLTFIAVYFYYFIGSTLEKQWGTAEFNIYFFSGVLLTVIYGFIIYFITGASVNLTAEYIYLSMFFSFAVMFPDMQVLLFFILPIKIKWLAMVDAAFFLLAVIGNPFPVNLLPLVAIVNFFIFCGDDLLSTLNIGRIKRNNPNTINFKKASKQVRREQAKNLYNHKCAVCGKTDTDYPDLEFRFCSKCAGYHCFCSEHINNHIHFTE
jgi:hypothetical protein